MNLTPYFQNMSSLAEAQNLSHMESLCDEDDRYLEEALRTLTTQKLYDKGLLGGEIDYVADEMFMHFDELPREEYMIEKATEKVLSMSLQELLDEGILTETYLVGCYVEMLKN